MSMLNSMIKDMSDSSDDESMSDNEIGKQEETENNEQSGDEDGDDEELVYSEEVCTIKEIPILEFNSRQEQVESYPYNFDAHVRWIEVLRHQYGRNSKILREARQRMASIFPLPPLIWLQWIYDEHYKQQNTSSCSKGGKEDDVEALTNAELAELFNKAVADYQSAEVWKAYIELQMARYCEGEEGFGAEEVRRTFECSLSSLQHHPLHSPTIFDKYRLFELTILDSLLELQKEAKDDSINSLVEEQRDRIRKLFHRQLIIPMVDLEDYYADYETWEEEEGKGQILDRITDKNEAAIEKWEARKPFEKRIAPIVDSTKDVEEYYEVLYAMYEYLEWEERQKPHHSGRLECLYERAAAKFCIMPEIWLRYAAFLSNRKLSGNKDNNKLIALYERAVRNCPWSGAIWCSYMHAIEKIHSDSEKLHESMTAVFNRSLSYGVSSAKEFSAIYTTLAYFRKRNHIKLGEDELGIRTAFEEGCKHLQTYFKNDTIELAKLQTEQAIVELFYYNSGMNFKKIIDAVLQVAGFSKYYAHWMPIFAALLSADDVDDLNLMQYARSLFKRACNTVADAPDQMFEAFINFEKRNGTLDDYLDAENRRTQRQRAVDAKHRKEAKEHEKQLKKKKSKDKNKDKSKDTRKRKRDDEDADQPSKKQKVNEKQQKQKEQQEAQPLFTVFLSNLPYKVTSQELYSLFTDCGNIKEVRLVKQKDGKLKGIAFIDFTDEAAQKAAVKKDQLEFKGRKVNIDIAKDIADRTIYSDKNTIFVSNLPFNVDSNELREYFEKTQTAKVKDVRLVLTPAGNSKGYGYIEMEDSTSLAAALKLDGTSLKNRNIRVKISRPTNIMAKKKIARTVHKKSGKEWPWMQNLSKDNSNNNNNKSNNKSSTGSKPRATLQLLPRAMQLGTKAQTSNNNSSNNNSNSDSKAEKVEPKSNDYFRKFLK